MATTESSLARLFIAGALSFILIGFLPALFGVSLPYYSRAFSLTEAQAGVLISFYGAGALTAVFAGVLRLPGLTWQTALAAIGLGAGLIAVELAWPLVLAGVAAQGVGLGLLTVIVNRRFLAEFGTRGPGMVGLVNAIFGIGAILSPILFVAAGGQPGPVFVGVIVLAVVLLPLVPGATGRARADAEAGPAARQGPDMRAFPILLFLMVAVMFEVAAIGLGPSALIAAGVPELTAAGLASAFFAAYLVTRSGLYWLTRVMAPAWLFLAGVVATAGAALLAALVSPSVGFILLGASVSVLFPTCFVWASRQVGSDARSASVIVAAAQIGATFGPLALGLVLARVGMGAVFPMIAGVALALAIAVASTLVAQRVAWRAGGAPQ
jgi:FHS family glucose/mannose:H+ symporter-like MFS transporter